jgi:hypothetical protein
MESIKSQFYQYVVTVKGEEFAKSLEDVLPFFDTIVHPTKKSRKKSRRNPTRPKRPISGYLAFYKTKRPEIQAKNPNKKSTEILSLAAVQWKNTPEEAKLEFNEIAKKDRERYDSEMTVWQSKQNSIQGGTPVTTPVATPPVAVGSGNASEETTTVIVSHKPRGRITPFSAFMKANRQEIKEQNLDKTAKEITSLLKAAWKATSKEDRQEYKDIAAKDKVRYQVEMAAWELYQQNVTQNENSEEVSEENDAEVTTVQ